MAEIVDTTRTQDHVTNDAGDCISTCPACAGFFGGPPARAEPSQSPQGECSHGETTSKPVVIMPQGNAGGSPAPLSSKNRVSAFTAAEWMSVGLIDKLVPLADYERLRAAIETVLAEDPGIAHHEQAAHCEWARKHLSIALASAGMPMVEAKACEFSDNARHECKHCDAEWAAVETPQPPSNSMFGNDIVTCCRAHQQREPLLRQAADEIEGLRAALERIANQSARDFDDPEQEAYSSREIASQALGGPPLESSAPSKPSGSHPHDEAAKTAGVAFRKHWKRDPTNHGDACWLAGYMDGLEDGVRSDETSGWRPIETAPKASEGFIWVACKDCMRPAFWSNYDQQWVDAERGESLHNRFTPTHWMPLPKPPV